MADTDCFIFSVCTPLSRLLLQNIEDMPGRGGDAEPTESEHFSF